ncbi:unnamed protein product [Gadus morhua 'NCC']
MRPNSQQMSRNRPRRKRPRRKRPRRKRHRRKRHRRKRHRRKRHRRKRHLGKTHLRTSLSRPKKTDCRTENGDECKEGYRRWEIDRTRNREQGCLLWARKIP